MATYLDENRILKVYGVNIPIRIICRDWEFFPGIKELYEKTNQYLPSGKVWTVITERLPDSLSQNWAIGHGETEEEAIENFLSVVKHICFDRLKK